MNLITAETLADLVPTHPDAEALAVMRLSFLDWLAVGLAGQNEPVSRLTRDLVLDESGVKQATLFGGAKVPARAAALANGACSHALDYDDTHFAHIGHPSVAVISAALAVGQLQGASFEKVVHAALMGCEASVRMGLLLGRGHYQVGFHQTATAGAFGAAFAAARLLSDDPQVLVQALGLVSTRAAGLKSQFGTMGKPYNAGIAASNGVESAMLAVRGFVSNPDALDGQNGFLPTHHADGTADQADGWLMRDVSHKYHACCHGLHAALEALEQFKPLDPNAVESVEITTHPRWMTVCNQQTPATGLEAKFSYRAVTALSLLKYPTAALDSFHDTLCHDPAVVALRDRVTVRADPNVPETASRVSIVTDGQRNEATFDLNTPMDAKAQSQRLQAKAAALLGQATAKKAFAAVHGNDLEAVVDILSVSV